MDTYSGYYDVLSRALGATDSATLQAAIDTYFEKYNGLQIEGFPFRDEMLLDFLYEQFENEFGIQVMANIYDKDSPAIPISTEGAKSYTGKIPRMKMIELMDEDKVRMMAITEQLSGKIDPDANWQKWFITTENLILAHANRLRWMVNQLRCKGKITLTQYTNNGVNPAAVELTFVNHVPPANRVNKTGQARWWTSATRTTANEGTQSDPIADLTALRDTQANKGKTGHYEVDKLFLRQVFGHSKVLAALALNSIASASISVEALTQASAQMAFQSFDTKKAILEQILDAPIIVRDEMAAIEKYNKTTKKIEKTPFRSFEDGVISFLPNGNIGETLTVRPIKVGPGTYGEFYGGKLLLTVDSDPFYKCQRFGTEMTSIPVPNAPGDMLYLRPCDV